MWKIIIFKLITPKPMDKQGTKLPTNHRIMTQNEYNAYLWHICGKTLGSMDTLKWHLNSHTEETYKCPMCTYHSPRMDAIRRHLLRHKTDREPPRPTMAKRLETKPYHTNPTSVNSYLYQQTMPKYKEVSPWILQELDAPPPRISRPYYIIV